jgi:hypothetical protein
MCKVIGGFSRDACRYAAQSADGKAHAHWRGPAGFQKTFLSPGRLTIPHNDKFRRQAEGGSGGVRLSTGGGSRFGVCGAIVLTIAVLKMSRLRHDGAGVSGGGTTRPAGSIG